MNSDPANFNALWARAIAQELQRGGVRDVFICPGSRSAPLALALYKQSGLLVRVVLDERCAAFIALGAAKAGGKPAAVLATSGTAGAHFYPAVLEAEASGTPLVLLTADRPPELHGFGAPQTMDQQHLFGRHAVAFADLGVPEPTDAALLHLRSVVTVCLSRATGARRGPVHLNVPFREPLAPSPAPLPEGLSARARDGIDGLPFVRVPPVTANIQSGLIVSLAGELRARPRGVIACGYRNAAGDLATAIGRLSAATGYPVIADAASGLRPWLPSAVTSADLLLRKKDLADSLTPEAVLRFGGGITSKVVQAWLDQSGASTILFSDGGDLHDPSHAAGCVLPPGAAGALAAAIAELGPAAGTLAAPFAAAEAQARAALEAAFARGASLTEPRIAREVAAAMPEGSQLVVSGSMPVRDLDAFGGSLAGVSVLANRGLNGIDGIVSTALGAALAASRPTAALLGDLALLHDLGALVAARALHVPLVLVVVNNGGGGIFHFLPAAEHVEKAAFEALFETPQPLDPAAAAALAGAEFHRPSTPAELRSAVRESLGRGLHLIEVRTDRSLNVAHHRALQAAVAEAL